MVDGSIRLSIVVEWANADRAGIDRSATMLREVERQIVNLTDADPAVARPVEILVVQADGTTTAPPVVEALARDQGDATVPAVVERHVLTAPPTGYYGLKNHGFAHSRGDIVVFIDSDVVPEPGWLAALLAPLADRSTQVVAGHAYIAPGGIYHKAFALFWFFPLRLERGARPSAPVLFGNNLAFRRETFARFPFVTDGPTSRGACLDLIARLTGAGVEIHHAYEACVAHPPPNGLAHFAARALAQGRDRWLRARAGARAEAGIAASVARAAGHIARSVARIATRRQEVNLSALEAPVAAAVAISYYSLSLVGEMLTRVSPDFMVRRFRI
jgi:glycosyltransferase involved in cell wall biosynthesis